MPSCFDQSPDDTSLPCREPARWTHPHLEKRDARCVQEVSREMERLRAECVNAGPLRRWWLRRRLKTVMREKAALEQRW